MFNKPHRNTDEIENAVTYFLIATIIAVCIISALDKLLP